MSQRFILHIDMDAFYASVEQFDRPELKGKPVIVGGGHRGVVSAASYEARAFGVHSAMPIFKAQKLCPQGVFLPVGMARYHEVSLSVMDLLSSFSPLLEQVSIDEAFLDVTGARRLKGDPVDIALEIKKRVKAEIGITCSVGVAPNKFLAKIASDLDKPDGLTVIAPEDVPAFIAGLPVSKIPGMGDKSVKKMKLLGVENVGDILKLPEDMVLQRFGKYGSRLLELARGIDERRVVTEHQVKSVSAERTFAEDTKDRSALRAWLLKESEEVGRRLRAKALRGKTVNLKIKSDDFQILTRGKTLDHFTDVTLEIYEAAVEMLDKLPLPRPIRLIGVGVSSLGESGPAQLSLWEAAGGENTKRAKVDRALDRVTDLYGKDSIRRGSLVEFD